MAVKITCYDGVNTIGGNKILLEDEERHTALFLDFGMSFSRRSLFFEEYLKPRPGVGLRDPLRLGLIPPLEGIYRTDLMAALSEQDRDFLTSQPSHRALSVQGVYLSHAHLDHSGYISFLREDLPIYCTAMTAAIAKVVEDVGQSGDLEREVCYFSRRELVNDVLSVAKEGGRSADYLGRPFVIVDEPAFLDSPFWGASPAGRKGIRPQRVALPSDRIGDGLVRAFPVDHSLYGATGCAVETSAGWV
ncbi:MAG: exonuclease, partial [Chloroflexi bacterium]|nr:exonuclease [Chloroflexota bacterium]